MGIKLHLDKRPWVAKANNIPVVIDGGSWKADLKQYCLGLIMPFVPRFLSAQL